MTHTVRLAVDASGTCTHVVKLVPELGNPFSRTSVVPLSGLDAAAAEACYGEMESEAALLLRDEGFGEGRQEMTRTIDIRYTGQEHSVTVSFPQAEGDIATPITRDFTRLHEQQYGHTMDDPVEVTTLRLRATGTVDKPSLPLLEERRDGAPERRGTRLVYLSEGDPAVCYELYSREALRASDVIKGPAVLAEHTATTVLHAGDVLRVGPYGEMVITVSQETQGASS